mmetsp:Transcript_36555/g.113084  ORF Transcript_36555/g.113084 Transcript_36555/m.113084 type:complete len:218 (+) Transcript_36555:606-1259(+)
MQLVASGALGRSGRRSGRRERLGAVRVDGAAAARALSRATGAVALRRRRRRERALGWAISLNKAPWTGAKTRVYVRFAARAALGRVGAPRSANGANCGGGVSQAPVKPGPGAAAPATNRPRDPAHVPAKYRRSACGEAALGLGPAGARSRTRGVQRVALGPRGARSPCVRRRAVWLSGCGRVRGGAGRQKVRSLHSRWSCEAARCPFIPRPHSSQIP